MNANNTYTLFYFFLLLIVPPKIEYMQPPTKLEVSKGASIKLECKASGNPAPTIVWSRKVSILK